MKIKKELVLRNIMDEYYLVPVGEAVYTHSGLFVMTDVAAQIWRILPDSNTVDEIVENIMKTFDTDEVSEEKIRQDVEEFLDELESMDILERR